MVDLTRCYFLIPETQPTKKTGSKFMLHSFSLVDVLGASHVVTPDMVLITATDKFLSGWGCASGLISKRIVICRDWAQADRIAANMRRQGFIYVNCRSARLGVPYYSPSKYVVSINHGDSCPAWNK